VAAGHRAGSLRAVTTPRSISRALVVRRSLPFSPDLALVPNAPARHLTPTPIGSRARQESDGHASILGDGG